MITGCYTLHLYCDNYTVESAAAGLHRYNEFPHEFNDEFGGKCRAAARKAGWSFNVKTGKATCPKCNKRTEP